MGLKKVTYIDETTIIEAENLNDIQDAIIDLENEEKLPAATAANNGKMLQIVKGKWTLVDAPSGGSGGDSGGGSGTYVFADIVDDVLVVYNSTADITSNDESGSANVITGPVGYILVNGADASVISDDSLVIW